MEFKSLLLCVLIILLAFQCSNAKCYEGNVGTKKELLRSSKTGNDDMFLHNDAKFLVGRKMLLVVDDKTSHISGGKEAADLYDSIDLQPILTSSADKNVVAKNERRIAKENDESEAADEMANLMQRDYKGAARRRSPIHNHQPNN